MHALEQPHAQRVRLAAALLPAERGLRAEFQGADGRDGLGQLRHRQLREVRQLHGALRLRGDGRRRHRGQSAEGAEGGVEGCRHRGRSDEHTSELQSLMRISYSVFCLKKTIFTHTNNILDKLKTITMNSNKLHISSNQSYP